MKTVEPINKKGKVVCAYGKINKKEGTKDTYIKYSTGAEIHKHENINNK